MRERQGRGWWNEREGKQGKEEKEGRREKKTGTANEGKAKGR